MFIRQIMVDEESKEIKSDLVIKMLTEASEKELQGLRKGDITTSLVISSLVANNSKYYTYSTRDNYLQENEIMIIEADGVVNLGMDHYIIELSLPNPYEDEGSIPIQDLYKNGLDKYTLFTHGQSNYVSININVISKEYHSPRPNTKYILWSIETIIDVITDFKMRFSKTISDI
jgi:hypothetical protein